ncbi:hypothetical protein Patl1_12597 [Pistacia atlantica]|uniref:Uncharacterized protein n=1 Tax=Pistacia atlantica TaxID=434234 RepID=A0ACC1AVR0_9ROSI|nr:hypothetical protein Patl1_12597 [Pistacia atlantica]
MHSWRLYDIVPIFYGNQVGPAPALIKAEVPCSARRRNLSDKERVLKTVKGIIMTAVPLIVLILNKLTPEKFDALKGQLIDYGITTPDILKGVISLIIDKAVLEPTFCPIATVCRGTESPKAYYPEVVNEAIALALEKNPPCVEPVIKLLEFLLGKNVLTTKDIGTGCLLYGSMLDDICIDVPKAPNNFGEVVGKLVVARGSGTQGKLYWAQGAEIQACESLLSQHAKPVMPAASLITSPEKAMAPAPKLNLADLQKKTISLLEEYFKAIALHSAKESLHVEPVIKLLEFLLGKNVLTTRDIGTGCLLYGSLLDDICIDVPKAPNNFGEVVGKLVVAREYFSVRILDEALQCVEELKAPAYYPGVVREAIALALQNNPPCVEPVIKLLEFLLAPNNFGEVVGKLVVARGLDFKKLKKVGDDYFRKTVFDAAMWSIGSSTSGEELYWAQGAEIQACESLLSQHAKPVMPAASLITSPEKAMAPAPKLNLADLQKKTISLLEEYFSVRILDEALQCVEELKAPAYYPGVVREAIALALQKNPPCVEPVIKLLEFLLGKNVLTTRDIGTGCLLYGSLLDDICMDVPKAPNNFGEVVGKLVVARSLDFKVVKEVLKKVEDDSFRKTIFDAAMRSIGSSPSGEELLAAQGAEIQACESLLA